MASWGLRSRMEGKGLLGGGKSCVARLPEAVAGVEGGGRGGGHDVGCHPDWLISPPGGPWSSVGGDEGEGWATGWGEGGGRLGRHGGVAERGSEHYLIPHQVSPPSPFRVTCPSCLGPREWVGAVSVT